MDRPNRIIYSSTHYYREDLENFTVDSYEMQFPRDLWGEDKKVKIISYDDLDIEDSIYKKATLNFKENFSLFDEDDKKPNTVIYDIEFDNVALSENSFVEYYTKTTPLNYSTLQPLIPGEYEYQNAIVGVQMRIPPTQGRFGIIGSKLHIDVEDTVEKGTVVLSAGGPSTVRLNKKFYTIPHVLTSLVDSEGVGVIEVSEVAKDYFVIGLKSLTNPTEYVSGTVDWLVDGF